MTITNIEARKVRPRIGLLPTGHFYYWDQFPRLKAMGEAMYAKLRRHLEEIGDVVAPQLVDTKEKAEAAGEFFRSNHGDTRYSNNHKVHEDIQARSRGII